MKIRSLSKLFEELQHLIGQNQSKPTILWSSETQLSSDQSSERYNMNDNKPFSSGNSINCHGDATYPHKIICFEIIEHAYCTFSNLTIQFSHEQYLIVIVYKCLLDFKQKKLLARY